MRRPAGADRAHRDEHAAEYRALEDRGWKGDHAAVVQRGLTDLVHRAPDAQQPVAFCHHPLEPPSVPEK